MSDQPWLCSYPDGVPATIEQSPDLTLYGCLHASAERFPQATAISFFGARIPYARLLELVDRFSSVLTAAGVTKGDRVALVLPNCPQYVIAYYATVRLGAVVVGNNPLYTERELGHQLADADAAVCIVLDALYPKLVAVRADTSIRRVIATKITDYMPKLAGLLAPVKLRREARKGGQPWPPVPRNADVTWWRAEMRGAPAPPAAAVLDPTVDLAGLIYTGGTTGLSKGAMLTHANLVANVLQARAWFKDAREGHESIMCVIPLFHAYGMTVGMNFGVGIAAELVLLPRFDLAAVLTQLERRRVTMLPGVPRIYIAINESPETRRHDLRSVRACLSGAAPLPDAVAEQFEAITGGHLVEGYGLTETSPITHANPLDGKRRGGAIGLPVPSTDCHLVDLADWTKPAPEGAQGELMISGPQVMSGYWNQAEETSLVLKTDAEGRRWLLTGDVATMDDEGYFRVVDRKKEMIDVSGFKVFPSDVEEVLYRNPKVSKACVLGVPDAKTGEAVKAFVVLHPGETATTQEIIDWCRDPAQGLAGFRVPTIVEFRDSLPESLVGKVLRRVLRDESTAAAPAS